MELIDLVSDLLYDKNCVIIPDFGGFVGNFKSADYQNNRLLVSPSRKKVAFNESLTENDGLLTNALQSRKGISYEQAEKEVALFASFLKDRLAKYKNYEFKNLGSLYLNKEGRLIFVAYDGANFHKPSFGLQDVKIKRLQHAVEQERQEVIATETITTKVVEMPKRKMYIPQVAASIAILCLFGVMLWQLLQTSAHQHQLAQTDTTINEPTASLIPDITAEDSEINAVDIPENAVVTETMDYQEVNPEDELTNSEVVETDISESPIETVEEVIPEPEVIETVETSKPEISPAAPAVEVKNKVHTPFTETVYYIAVAKNYTDQIKSKKTSALERLEYNVFELQSGQDKILCIEKFISRDNANAFLKIVKAYDDRNAFIYENQE